MLKIFFDKMYRVVLFVILVGIVFPISSCDDEDPYEGFHVYPFKVAGKDTLETASGLKYIVVKAGSGKQAYDNAKIKFDFTAYYALNQQMFYSSYYRGYSPREVYLSTEYLIPGLYEGILLMKKGSKYKFLVPTELAYGSNYGYPPYTRAPIKPYTSLNFDVELLHVE